MTRKDFIAKIAADGDMTKAAAQDMLELFEKEVQDIVLSEDEFLFKFGKLSGVTVPAHKGHNPFTGEAIDIPTKHGVPKMHFSKSIKDKSIKD